tara:strand:- start:129 stop:1022 length:894 start_codon:yes stop_codon:yes gene_type:complete
MAAFPRTVKPASVTYPQNIGSLISVGQSGGLQTRSQVAQGLIWQETWPALPAGNEDVQELLVTIQNLYNTGATCTLTQYLLPGSGLPINGSPANCKPVVDGASQSGTTLNTDAWPNSEGVLKAGDAFTIDGIDVLFRATADVTSHASGGTTAISIMPPIVAGSSPADGAAIRVAQFLLQANPIATVDDSTIITVANNASIPTAVGHTVVLSGSAAVGGISADRLNTTMEVITKPDANTFTADIGGADATSTVSAGGGSSVVVTLRASVTAVILDYDGAVAGPSEYIGGLSVTFQEAP